MHKARFVMVVGASVGLAWGGVVACSSTNGGTSSGEVATVDSGAGHDSSQADSSSPQVDSSTNQDAGSDCGAAAALHPPAGDGGVYCPFSAPPGGKNIYCSVTEQCCENPKGGGVSTCVTKGTACPNAAATVWQCEDPADCPGEKCCAHSGDAGAVTVATDTCGPYLSKFSGTRCAATCATGELVVCEKQPECTTGTCTAVKPKGNDIGVCQ